MRASTSATTGACKKPDEIRAFLLGKLAPDDLNAVADHLDTCPQCVAVLMALPISSYGLLAELRGLGAARIPADEAALEPEMAALEASLPEPGWVPQNGCADDLPPPIHLRDYRILEKLGEGGMGEVWVARQSEPVKRKVAIKFIKTGMDSRAVLTRFEQERQALAVMDHPNIARVFDGGLAPTGTPFFVMELVAGLPLNKYCDEAKLSVHDRLQLFVSICQAV